MMKDEIVRKLRITCPIGVFLALGFVVAFTSPFAPVHAADFTVYKSPNCGCCAKWVEHLQENGHKVAIKDAEELMTIKKKAGVPRQLQSCHTAIVEGYVIEGHVPAKDISRLLTERPKAKGLAVPGMPTGSPGMEMEGVARDKYNVILFQSDGTSSVYTSH